MPVSNNITQIWTLLKEIDISAIRAQVRAPLRVAALGSDRASLNRLAALLQANPFTAAPELPTGALTTQTLPAPPEAAAALTSADVILLLVQPLAGEPLLERQAFAALRAAAPGLPVIIVSMSQTEVAPVVRAADWENAVQVRVSADAVQPLAEELIPALLRLFPDRQLALAHHLPALRAAVARDLINETCTANASYAVGAGVAEIVPVLNIPLNLADMVVLTKNQTVMAYKMALALGRDGELQDVVGPLAGVLGAGFVWRQVARSLVGFIPGIGLITKVAVAYAGTYVAGHAALNWYAHGQKLSTERMRALYAEAALEAKARAASLIPARLTKLRLPTLKPLPLPKPRAARRCPHCRAKVSAKAQFCPNCGLSLTAPTRIPAGPNTSA